ncbi:hypothetical protein AB4851_13060 [Burkholderia sp. 22PA0099]|uniref:hypothetical protein n=1 Tax=Burkholderia sp. 22PA0099 TaxID=3237372 RepID=UPI0039C22B07
MPLTLAGRRILDTSNLSEAARLTLSLIEGGTAWFAWAVAAPNARYDFADETQLVAAVQQGLHAAPLALLPALRLLVNPIKLLSLSAHDLRVLAAGEASGAAPEALERARALLDAHQLLTQDALAAGTDFLAQLGVDGAPLFQAVDLDGRLALAVLAGMDEVARHPEFVQHEAAAFAVANARTALEFADLFRFYLDSTERLGNPAAHAAQRREAAQAALDHLYPALFGALDCPQVTGLPAPFEVAQVVRNWVASGRALGFVRLSRGALQVARHGGYRGEQGEQAQQLVARYLADATAFLMESEVSSGVLGQDGGTCSYPIGRDGRHAVVQLSHGGLISLATYQAAGV